MINQTAKDKINALHDKYVPWSGPAETLIGELVRATCRIGYRFYNDGDQIGVGYGKETCNAPARFILAYGSPEMAEAVITLWGLCDERRYEGYLNVLCEETIDYVETLIANGCEDAKSPCDMWDLCDRDEDVDECDDEDDVVEEEEF